MSTHRVDIVKVKLLPHPNADSLSLVQVLGFQVVVRTADWQNGQLAAYIQPDSVVPDAPEYAFLRKDGPLREKDRRIKVARLRGMISQGLLMPAPDGAKEGDDVAEARGVTHYEPPIQLDGKVTGGDDEKGPAHIFVIKYDVENLRRYTNVFIPGETVVATEKIHGANSRYVYSSVDQRMFCGSRQQWKQESETNLWWRLLPRYPGIEKFCRTFPDTILYGEVYGMVQELHYGVTQQDPFRFAAFDVLGQGQYWEMAKMRRTLTSFEVPTVPVLYTGSFDLDVLLELAEGKTTLPGADHVREGIVIRPVPDRYHGQVGRVQLKLVGNSYMEKAK